MPEIKMPTPIKISETTLVEDLKQIMNEYCFKMFTYDVEVELKMRISIIEEKYDIKIPIIISEDKTNINFDIPKEILNTGFKDRGKLNKKLKKVKYASTTLPRNILQNLR